MVGNKKTGILILIFSAIIAFLAGKEFLKMREPEPIQEKELLLSKN